MAYEKHRRVVSYFNEYYTRLLESYSHKLNRSPNVQVRDIVKELFVQMPEEERLKLIEYHSRMGLGKSIMVNGKCKKVYHYIGSELKRIYPSIKEASHQFRVNPVQVGRHLNGDILKPRWLKRNHQLSYIQL